ncbi:TetR/AcrR family transcriptional regulator [Rhodococcus koreensis]
MSTKRRGGEFHRGASGATRSPTRASTPRRPGRPGYDLDSLLAVSVKVFNEKGYDGTSMVDLSDRLGITKSSIYHHVSGKAELLELALQRALNALFAVTTEHHATTGRYIDRLEYLVRRSVETVVTELPYITLLLRARGNNPVERRAIGRRQEFDALLDELVRAAAEEGTLRADIRPGVTSRLVFGMATSLIEWYMPRPGKTAEELADNVVELAFNGIRGV